MFPDINKILAEVAAFSQLLNAVLETVNSAKVDISAMRAEVDSLKGVIHTANSGVSNLVAQFSATDSGEAQG